TQLLTFSQPGSQLTLPLAEFLIGDIGKLTSAASEQQPNIEKIRNGEVGSLLAALVLPPEYDFAQPGNVEFDRIALRSSDPYKKYLTQEPKRNMEILHKYFETLRKLHDEKVTFFEAVEMDRLGGLTSKLGVPDDIKYARFHYLVLGYQSHAE